MTGPDESAIVIRGVEEDDWEGVSEVMNNASVVYNTLLLPFTSRDKIRDRMENPQDNYYGLVAELEGVIVGLLGLEVGAGRREHSARLYLAVHGDYQGQGVGTALMQAAIDLAEHWLAISRIELEVFVDNAPGLALYQKMGFEIEGTLREYGFRDGRYVDAYLMSRIRDEQPHD